MSVIQVVRTESGVWFAKNSDREPREPQVVVRQAPVFGDTARLVKTTYLEIPQVSRRYGVLMSKPAWCWGAEMGVNEKWVCIGHAAVFSTRRTLKPALLGMDLVRLGLERSASASDAVTVITRLLEAHGQGGSAGFFDKGFHADSSFVIADPEEAWVLECAGASWAARRINGAYAVANAYTLGSRYDLCSQDLAAYRPSFRVRFDTHLMPMLLGAPHRRRLSLEALKDSTNMTLARCASNLRLHHSRSRGPARGSNRDICLHAAGSIRRLQTTGAMVACLASEPGQRGVYFTGTSATCLSLFRPAALNGDFSVLTEPAEASAAPLWSRAERLHRQALVDRSFRRQLREHRDRVEQQVFACQDLEEADLLAQCWLEAMEAVLATRPEARIPRFWR
ncbi:MAG: C69 family dipeptidase [Marinobacter sp.]|nr:C69 family dipeptidase [Marinobacter sp.]